MRCHYFLAREYVNPTPGYFQRAIANAVDNFHDALEDDVSMLTSTGLALVSRDLRLKDHEKRRPLPPFGSTLRRLENNLSRKDPTRGRFAAGSNSSSVESSGENEDA